MLVSRRQIDTAYDRQQISFIKPQMNYLYCILYTNATFPKGKKEIVCSFLTNRLRAMNSFFNQQLIIENVVMY